MLTAPERLVIVKSLDLLTRQFCYLEGTLHGHALVLGPIGEAKPALAPREGSLVHYRDVNQTSVFLPARRMDRAYKFRLFLLSRSLLESQVSQVDLYIGQMEGLNRLGPQLLVSVGFRHDDIVRW